MVCLAPASHRAQCTLYPFHAMHHVVCESKLVLKWGKGGLTLLITNWHATCFGAIHTGNSFQVEELLMLDIALDCCCYYRVGFGWL